MKPKRLNFRKKETASKPHHGADHRAGGLGHHLVEAHLKVEDRPWEEAHPHGDKVHHQADGHRVDPAVWVAHHPWDKSLLKTQTNSANTSSKRPGIDGVHMPALGAVQTGNCLPLFTPVFIGILPTGEIRAQANKHGERDDPGNHPPMHDQANQAQPEQQDIDKKETSRRRISPRRWRKPIGGETGLTLFTNHDLFLVIVCQIRPIIYIPICG